MEPNVLLLFRILNIVFSFATLFTSLGLLKRMVREGYGVDGAKWTYFSLLFLFTGLAMISIASIITYINNIFFEDVSLLYTTIRGFFANIIFLTVTLVFRSIQKKADKE